jgi:hypothetical protein
MKLGPSLAGVHLSFPQISHFTASSGCRRVTEQSVANLLCLRKLLSLNHDTLLLHVSSCWSSVVHLSCQLGIQKNVCPLSSLPEVS